MMTQFAVKTQSASGKRTEQLVEEYTSMVERSIPRLKELQLRLAEQIHAAGEAMATVQGTEHVPVHTTKGCIQFQKIGQLNAISEYLDELGYNGVLKDGCYLGVCEHFERRMRALLTID